ncbi:MAG: hypothetical protein ACK44A_10930 [Roseateles sp.]
MHTLTKALVLAGLFAQLGAAQAMDAPPPVHKGWQRMVIDTPVDAWSGPQLPGVDIGTRISASWIFNSDVVAPTYTSVREFALKLAGVVYDGGDLIGDGLMLNYEGTQGIGGSFTLQAQGGLPELHMSVFEEFSTSHLVLTFGQDGGWRRR